VAGIATFADVETAGASRVVINVPFSFHFLGLSVVLIEKLVTVKHGPI
jgi:hypothetical protein